MGIRSLEDLTNVYHQTVGRNGVLEMDFAIDRTGAWIDRQRILREIIGDIAGIEHLLSPAPAPLAC